MKEDTMAEAVARAFLATELPARWRHVCAVAAQAARVARVLSDAGEGELLLSAAWLHDIGYAAAIRTTGFHPLDGAEWLVANGWSRRLAALVAHHSGAWAEAEERGIALDLKRFPREVSAVSDGLWYADLATGPNGETMTLDGRLREIASRYGAGHVVIRAIERAKTEMKEAVARTEAVLKAREKSGNRVDL